MKITAGIYGRCAKATKSQHNHIEGEVWNVKGSSSGI